MKRLAIGFSIGTAVIAAATLITGFVPTTADEYSGSYFLPAQGDGWNDQADPDSGISLSSLCRENGYPLLFWILVILTLVLAVTAIIFALIPRVTQQPQTAHYFFPSPGAPTARTWVEPGAITADLLRLQQLHREAAWSAGTEFGERLVNSMFTLSTLVGLSVAQLTMGTIVANLGFSDVSFPAPVRIGDALYAETLIVSKRLSSSRPGQGIVELAHTGRNQDGTVVARATRSTLVQCLPQEANA